MMMMMMLVGVWIRWPFWRVLFGVVGEVGFFSMRLCGIIFTLTSCWARAEGNVTAKRAVRCVSVIFFVRSVFGLNVYSICSTLVHTKRRQTR